MLNVRIGKTIKPLLNNQLHKHKKVSTGIKMLYSAAMAVSLKIILQNTVSK
jgi:hypothetical protein